MMKGKFPNKMKKNIMKMSEKMRGDKSEKATPMSRSSSPMSEPYEDSMYEPSNDSYGAGTGTLTEAQAVFCEFFYHHQGNVKKAMKAFKQQEKNAEDGRNLHDFLMEDYANELVDGMLPTEFCDEFEWDSNGELTYIHDEPTYEYDSLPSTSYDNGSLSEKQSGDKSETATPVHTLDEIIRQYTNEGWSTTNDPNLPVVFKFFDHELMTWHEAKEFCESNFYTLATIYSQAENDLLTSFDFSNGKSFWIGGHDPQGQNDWEWVYPLEGEAELIYNIDNNSTGFTDWNIVRERDLSDNCIWVFDTGMGYGTWYPENCNINWSRIVCQIRF